MLKLSTYIKPLSVSINIGLTMTNNTYQVDFHYGELDESHNFSNLLRIVVNLIPPKKNEGPLPHSLVILYIILLIILETLGNFLLFCIICYEKNGMDSKKRTVTNMLLSRMIFVQILCNIFIMPVLTISEIRIFGVYCKYFIYHKCATISRGLYIFIPHFSLWLIYQSG